MDRNATYSSRFLLGAFGFLVLGMAYTWEPTIKSAAYLFASSAVGVASMVLLLVGLCRLVGPGDSV